MKRKLLGRKSISFVMLMIFFLMSNVLVSQNTDALTGKSNSSQFDEVKFQIAMTQEQFEMPLQTYLQESIEERSLAQLPKPQTISYTKDFNTLLNKGIENSSAGQTIIITATTIIDFEHPSEAGFDKWPELIIDDQLPFNARGFVIPGNYSKDIQLELALINPEIWKEYEFGYEPRRYTYHETLIIEYYNDPSEIFEMQANNYFTGPQDLVMGFSTSGPEINYTVEEIWEECLIICVTLAEAKAGFELDWNIGFRLPLSIDVDASNPMSLGSSNPMSIAITPLDWSGNQFEQVGLEAVDGNEFLLQYVFFLGAQATILGVDVVGWSLDAEYDASRSFVTPLGAGASFPLPTLDLSPDATGLDWTIGTFMSVGIGLSFLPNLEMGGITADWEAVPESDASGNGSITYNIADSPITFGTIIADDFSPTTSFAQVRLDNFRYLFNEFLIELGGFLQFELFGYGVKTGTFEIADFDLSGISDGQWFNPHSGTKMTVEEFFLVTDEPPVFLPMIRRE